MSGGHIDEQAGRLQKASAAPDVSRRGFLAAASGMTLSASGLFLPGIRAEAAVREGANGGKLGGRRGSDRRGRDKNRDHGDKKNTKNRKRDEKNSAPGRGLLGNIVLSIQNTAPDSQDIPFWLVGGAGGLQHLTIKRHWSETFYFNDDWGNFFVQYSGGRKDADGFPIGVTLMFVNPTLGTPWVQLRYDVSLTNNGMAPGQRTNPAWNRDMPELASVDADFVLIGREHYRMPFTLSRSSDSPSQWIKDKNFYLVLHQQQSLRPQ
jgi:hypothetical protein